MSCTSLGTMLKDLLEELTKCREVNGSCTVVAWIAFDSLLRLRRVYNSRRRPRQATEPRVMPTISVTVTLLALLVFTADEDGEGLGVRDVGDMLMTT